MEADFHRTYHLLTESPEVNAVPAEAGEGRAWLQVGVYGKPQSELKVIRAAEYLKLMLSRLPM